MKNKFFIITGIILAIFACVLFIKSDYEKLVSGPLKKVDYITIDDYKITDQDEIKKIYNILQDVKPKGEWLPSEECTRLMVDRKFVITIIYKNNRQDILYAFRVSNLFKELPTKYGISWGKCTEIWDYYEEFIR